MPLTPEKITALKTSCKTVKNKKKPIKFFYCAAGQDGDPALVIGKTITAEKKELKKTAKKKKFVEGTVRREKNKLQFITEAPPTAKFAKDLKNFWGAKIGDLKKAQIKTAEEIEEEKEAIEAEQQAKAEAKSAPEPEETGPEEAEQEEAEQEADEDKDPDFFALLGPEDSKRVNSLKAKFKEKGMDSANAEKAAKAAAVLKKDDSPDKGGEPNLAPFALDMATKQITQVEQKVAELRDLRVDRAAEADVVDALAQSAGIDNEIRQLNANARVYLSLARKSAVGDPQSAAAGQALASRLEELLTERGEVIEGLRATLAEVQAQLQARQDDADEAPEDQQDELQALSAETLNRPLSDDVVESEVQQIQGEELGYTTQDDSRIDPEDAEEEAEDEAEESLRDEDSEEDEGDEPEASEEEGDEEASEEDEDEEPAVSEEGAEPDEDSEEDEEDEPEASEEEEDEEEEASEEEEDEASEEDEVEAEEEEEEEEVESLDSLDSPDDVYEEDRPEDVVQEDEEDSEEEDEGEEEGEESEEEDAAAGPAQAAAGAAAQAVAAGEKPAGAKQATPAMLQERLNELGFDCGEVDGVVGPKTKAAVRAFQKANELAADGVVGQKTLAALGFAGKKLLPQLKPPPPPVAAAAAAVAAALGGVASAVTAAAATVAGAAGAGAGGAGAGAASSVDKENEIGPDDDETIIAMKRANQERLAAEAAKKKKAAEAAKKKAAAEAAKKKAAADAAAKEEDAAAKAKAAEEAAEKAKAAETAQPKVAEPAPEKKPAAQQANAQPKGEEDEEDEGDEPQKKPTTQPGPSKPAAKGPPGYEDAGTGLFQHPETEIWYDAEKGLFVSPEGTFQSKNEQEVINYVKNGR